MLCLLIGSSNEKESCASNMHAPSSKQHFKCLRGQQQDSNSEAVIKKLHRDRCDVMKLTPETTLPEACGNCARQLAHAGLVERGEVQRASVRVAVAEQALERVNVLQRGRLLCCQAW